MASARNPPQRRSELESWVYVAVARNRTLCENRGRRSVLWTFAKTLAGVWFEGLRVTRQAQWICTMDAIWFEVEGLDSWEGLLLKFKLEDDVTWPVQHFVWPRVMSRRRRSTSETCFQNVNQWTFCGDRARPSRWTLVKLRCLILKPNPLRGLYMLSARNAGKVAFLLSKHNPLRGSCVLLTLRW